MIAFDISLALACFFGIGALVERFDWLQRLILIVGGCIVVWIGIGLLRDKPTLDRDVDVSIPLPRLAAKAFVVTWICLLYTSRPSGQSAPPSRRSTPAPPPSGPPCPPEAASAARRPIPR